MPFLNPTAGASRPVKLNHQKRESSRLLADDQIALLNQAANAPSLNSLLPIFDLQKPIDSVASQMSTKTASLPLSPSPPSTKHSHYSDSAFDYNQPHKPASEYIVGSRKSNLAVTQTKLVISMLQDVMPTASFPLTLMSTTGDRIQSVSLSKIGEKSLFTKELEYALIENKVDLVVHSLKDLPTVLPDGMAIRAILKREDPRDVSIMGPNFQNYKLQTLPPGSVVGTSSVRRIAQLSRAYPHLVFKDIRGNLNTRFNKLNCPNSEYAAVILAAAGVLRLGFGDIIAEYIDSDIMMYAVGQGALAVEARSNDSRVEKLLNHIVHTRTLLTCAAERALMRYLEGGCSVPIGVNSSWTDSLTRPTSSPTPDPQVEYSSSKQYIRLSAMVSSIDGADYLKSSHIAHVVPENLAHKIDRFELLSSDEVDILMSNAERVGYELGATMRSLGADRILSNIERH